jgi:hypothetical protein
MAGGFFLLTILCGVFAQGFVSQRLINFSNAAETATNILAHKSLFQLGFTAYIIEMACQVITAALFYVLLVPVSKSIALTSTFLELTGCIIKTFARVFFIVALFMFAAPASLSVFNTQQSQSIALRLLKIK